MAPADGVVLTRAVDPGNTVAASLQAVTLFTVAEDLTRLRLWVYVDEADVGAGEAGPGLPPSRSAPTRRAASRPGSRAWASARRSPTTSVTYLTYLDVDNADLALRPGMTATATIVADQRSDVLLVPNTALRFTPTATVALAAKPGVMSSLTPRMPGGNASRSAAAGASTAGAKQVWVLAGSDDVTPVRVAVTPGISDGRMTEITGGDLQGRHARHHRPEDGGGEMTEP